MLSRLRHRHHVAILAASLTMAISLGGAATASAGTVVVTPGSLQGWTTVNIPCSGTLTSTGSFVNGPATPPAGSGSVRFTLGSNDDSWPHIRQSLFDGTDVADLTALSYHTFITGPPSANEAPFVRLDVDIDSPPDGIRDDTLVFRATEQGAVVQNVWQFWNSLPADAWYSTENPAGRPSEPFTLQGTGSYTDVFPDAEIRSAFSGGGVSLGTGCASEEFGPGTDFDGNIDAFQISSTTIPDPLYDFELAGAGPTPAPTPGPPGTADLAVSKSDGPDPVTVGGNLVYGILVGNFGPASASATLTDTIPGGTSLISAVPSQGSCGGAPTVVCNLGTLNSGSVAAITITVRPDAAGTLVNNASVASATTDHFTGNNFASTSTLVNPAAGTTGGGGVTIASLGGSRACDWLERRCFVVVECINDTLDCTAVGTGRVLVAGRAVGAASYRFRRARRTVGAQEEEDLVFRVRSSRGRRAITRALRRGRRVRAKVKVVVTDSAGNQTVRRRTLRLVR